MATLTTKWGLACKCDNCGHRWWPKRVDADLPKRCPSRDCRARRWNIFDEKWETGNGIEAVESLKRVALAKLDEGISGIIFRPSL